MPKAVLRSELFVPIRRDGATPIRLQLERALRRAIQDGRLASGSALPSTRVLASNLGVSRGIVVQAYEQLIAEGYLDARRGSGTRVAARPTTDTKKLAEPEAAPAFRYDFRPGRPDPALFPRRAWMSALREKMSSLPHAALGYPDPRGVPAARVALAEYLNRARATVTRPDRLLLCTGVAQAMRLVCAVLRARGHRRIAVEDPGHAFESPDIKSAGLELVPIPVDEEGVCIDRLAGANVGAVFVTPAHQYPTGFVLSARRRAALLSWAEDENAFVLEDDYDAEYRYDREPLGTLQGLSPERVVYFGSASKILAPALRIGWVVAPTELMEEISRAKLEADRGSPVLDQLALGGFIERGDLDRHLRRTRGIYRKRRERMAAALRTHLPDLPIRGVAAGLHLVLELPEILDEDAIVVDAARRSVGVYGVGVYRSPGAQGPPALLLGYCRMSGNASERGVKELAAVLEAHRA